MKDKYLPTLEHAPGKYCVVDTAVKGWDDFIKKIQGIDRLNFGFEIMSLNHPKAKAQAYELYCNNREFSPYDLAIELGLLEKI